MALLLILSYIMYLFFNIFLFSLLHVVNSEWASRGSNLKMNNWNLQETSKCLSKGGGEEDIKRTAKGKAHEDLQAWDSIRTETINELIFQIW